MGGKHPPWICLVPPFPVPARPTRSRDPARQHPAPGHLLWACQPAAGIHLPEEGAPRDGGCQSGQGTEPGLGRSVLGHLFQLVPAERHLWVFLRERVGCPHPADCRAGFLQPSRHPFRTRRARRLPLSSVPWVTSALPGRVQVWGGVSRGLPGGQCLHCRGCCPP